MDFQRNIKILIFDFDGTLHDLPVNWAKLKKSLGILNTGESLGEAIDRFKYENNKRMLQIITDFELAALTETTTDADTLDTIRILKSKYSLSILTRNSNKVVEAWLKRSGLQNIYVIGRENVKKIKPDPEGIYKILEHFHYLPAEAILIGDTTHDVIAAKAANLKCIIVGNNYIKSAKSKKPDFHIRSIQDVIPLVEGRS